MKVEHISSITHYRVMRDTTTILKETEKHFAFLGIKEGKKVAKIPKTPLTCRVTAADGVAIFDLMIDEQILFVNVCCFSDEKKEEAMKYVDALASKQLLKSETLNPSISEFIYSVAVMPFASADILQLCGEIELYIYYELYKTWKK